MYLGFSSMNTADDPAPHLLAKTLEEAGFESLWYGEHSHIPVARRTPYPPGAFRGPHFSLSFVFCQRPWAGQ